MPRFQYRLRTVLIVMAVLAVPLGWWSWRAEKQRRVMEALDHRPYVHVQYANDGRTIEAYFELDVSDDDIKALQELYGPIEVTASFNNEARLRAALPNCKFEGYGAFAAP